MNAQERVDKLHIHGLNIIQNQDFFRYGTDAVLLSWYAAGKINRKLKVADLGTGSGIIPILLSLSKAGEIHGLELQPHVADMAKRSVEMNSLTPKITIIQGDVRELPEFFLPNTYDMVVSNPPYMNAKEGFKNIKDTVAVSRHELQCTMKDIAFAAKRLLKTKGRFVLVHRPNRIVDIFYEMRLHNIEPKAMILIKPKKSKEANMVIIEGLKEGKPGLKILPDIVVYEEDGSYTKQILEIYGKESS
ncbi:MAG: tRNA1(Val) (adenine(37)-N6)-methyltransferase [Eubacteriaceae bacterium]|nr:tRNA1(Val) (adenine(37)-N6)-methyltransferase [Eubacteriaceae bacterium]